MVVSMRPEKRDFRHAIIAGFVATLILTALMYLAPMMGLPRIDMAASLGIPVSGREAAMFSPAWFGGLAIFFVFGSIISPWIFVYLFPALIGKPWLRGLEWGVLVWFFGGVGIMTLLGLGFNESHFAHPFSSFFSSLAGHLLYGVLLGLIAGGALTHLQAQTKTAA